MNCLEFIHITKTGGTSIENWGIENNIKWGFKNRNFLNKYKYTNSNKISWRSKWHVPPSFFSNNPYKNKVTFTVVRNPYTRIISE